MQANDSPVRAHTGIDHGKDHGVFGKVHMAGCQKESGLRHVERGHVMGNIDDRAGRSLAVYHRFHLADIRIGKPEISEQSNGARRCFLFAWREHRYLALIYFSGREPLPLYVEPGAHDEECVGIAGVNQLFQLLELHG